MLLSASALVGVCATREYMYLYLNEKNADVVVLLRCRVFPSEGMILRFKLIFGSIRFLLIIGVSWFEIR